MTLYLIYFLFSGQALPKLRHFFHFQLQKCQCQRYASLPAIIYYFFKHISDMSSCCHIGIAFGNHAQEIRPLEAVYISPKERPQLDRLR
jgi:hypothetical protein